MQKELYYTKIIEEKDKVIRELTEQINKKNDDYLIMAGMYNALIKKQLEKEEEK
ncbi:hypothetical protein [Clostridium baratii]|uniref:hypothetical protein n=1 Tax=Clostridium baratii TaxID=1561 RepID=UPI0029429444|nr:hypothetical protein [Clostridium baratii]